MLLSLHFLYRKCSGRLGMRFFFVDYENTGVKGLEGIRELNSDDKVLIFFGKDSKISVKTLLKLNKVKPKVEFYESIDSFKNANDFQIFAKIGLLLGSGLLEKSCIISSDKCFQLASSFFVEHSKSKSLAMFTAKNISEALGFDWESSETPAKPSISSHEKVMDLLRKRIKIKSVEDRVEELCSVVESASELKDLHNSLIKTFGSETGKYLYQRLKACFNELKIA